MENLKIPRITRSYLIQSLKNITAMDDVSSETVSSWSASLYSLVLNPYEISQTDVDTVAYIANKIVQSVVTLQVDSSTPFLGVLQAQDTILSLRKYNYNPDAFSSNAVKQYPNNTADSTIAIIGLFGNVMLQTATLGQNSTTYLYNNFRISVQLQSLSAQEGSAVIESPQSAQETQLDLPASTATLNPSADSAATLAVKVILLYPRAYTRNTAGFVSNPMLLQIQPQASALVDRTLSSIDFTFQHNEPEDKYVHQHKFNLTSHCTSYNDTYSFFCPDSGIELVHNCSRGAGVYTSYCPKPAPACAKLDEKSADITIDSSCKVIRYNATYTTCSCALNTTARSVHVSSRYLQEKSSTVAEGLLDDSGAVNMVTTTTFIANNFEDTFTASSKLNSFAALKEVYIVIVFIAGLWVVLLLPFPVECISARFVSRKKVQDAPPPEEQAEVDPSKQLITYAMFVIPSVFTTDVSFLQRILKELCTHHAFFKLFNTDEPWKKRQESTVKLLIQLTFMIFLVAVLYDASNPSDDGSCVNYVERVTCLKQRSPFDNSHTYCTWSEAQQATAYQCTFNTEPPSLKSQVYMYVLITIITSLMSIPLDLLLSIVNAPAQENFQNSKVSDISNISITGGNVVQQAARRVSNAVFGPARQPLNSQAAVNEVIANRDISEEFVEARKLACKSFIAVVAASRTIVERAALKEQLLKPTTSLLIQPVNLAITNYPAENVRAANLSSMEADITPKRVQEVASSMSLLCANVIIQRELMRDGTLASTDFDQQWGIKKRANTDEENPDQQDLYYLMKAHEKSFTIQFCSLWKKLKNLASLSTTTTLIMLGWKYSTSLCWICLGETRRRQLYLSRNLWKNSRTRQL